MRYFRRPRLGLSFRLGPLRIYIPINLTRNRHEL